MQVGNGLSTESTQFLGIHLDERLTWKSQLKHLNSKISRTIFSINQVKNTLPQHCLLYLYQSLIQPLLMYGILAWGNASKSALDKTIRLQKRGIRVVNRAQYKSHTEPLFKNSSVLKLNDIYEQQVVLFVLDYVQGRLPSSFNNVFLFNSDLNTEHRTRQSKLMHVPKGRTCFCAKLPYFNYPRIWNKWCFLITDNISRKALKNLIQDHILANYDKHVS